MKTYFVVTGIVKHEDSILILRKSHDDQQYPNKWSFCSGFVKEFEAAEETVLREIKEETGLDASIIKKAGLIEAEDAGRSRSWVIMVFLCNSEKTDVKLDHENSEYSWIKREELKDYDFVPGIMDNLSNSGIEF